MKPISRTRLNPLRWGVNARLLAFADREGLVLTSGRGGGHNKGSAHYRGLAIDVRSRHLTERFVDHLKRAAIRDEIILRDERRRPEGQRVWSGPHLHLEIPS